MNRKTVNLKFTKKNSFLIIPIICLVLVNIALFFIIISKGRKNDMPGMSRNPAELVTTGDELLKSGNLEGALKHYYGALKLSPESRDLYKKISRVYLKMGKVDEAINMQQQEINSNPSSDDAHINMGELYFSLRRYLDAKQEFEKALELSHKPLYYVFIGETYAQQGIHAEGEKWFKKAIKEDPECFDAYLDLAIGYADQKKWKEAETVYKKAAKIKPGSHLPLTGLGIVYMNSDRGDEAEKIFKKAILLDPDAQRAYSALALLYSKSGKYRKAERLLEKAIKINPYEVVYHVNLGEVYFLTKRPNKAEREFKEAVKVRPDYSASYFKLAKLYEKTDRPEEAKKMRAMGEEKKKYDQDIADPLDLSEPVR